MTYETDTKTCAECGAEYNMVSGEKCDRCMGDKCFNCCRNTKVEGYDE